MDLADCQIHSLLKVAAIAAVAERNERLFQEWYVELQNTVRNNRGLRKWRQVQKAHHDLWLAQEYSDSDKG